MSGPLGNFRTDPANLGKAASFNLSGVLQGPAWLGLDNILWSPLLAISVLHTPCSLRQQPMILMISSGRDSMFG